MELKIDISYNELLSLIKQLPANQIAKIKAELDDKTIAENSEKEISNFQQFLLGAPTMSDEQYTEFRKNRLKFSEWRKK